MKTTRRINCKIRVFFTSGLPGIMCPHRGAVFSYYHRHETYPYFYVGDQSKQPKQESENQQPYDGEEREGVNIFFTWEMLRPLLRNVTLYVITNHTIYDPPVLCSYLEKNKITRLLVTPSLLETVINTQPGGRIQDGFKTLRWVATLSNHLISEKPRVKVNLKMTLRPTFSNSIFVFEFLLIH